jgi:hypothetical protein
VQSELETERFDRLLIYAPARQVADAIARPL